MDRRRTDATRPGSTEPDSLPQLIRDCRALPARFTAERTRRASAAPRPASLRIDRACREQLGGLDDYGT
ncbi:hypothetical protein FHR81_004789 [Actinoalloteichus hoggarensis]|nr:hypothetical protein [Actinoalloteichus hoggarensis]MBB5923716.1 hypothetical protein [Actinoalloteichus hoggarensis]